MLLRWAWSDEADSLFVLNNVWKIEREQKANKTKDEQLQIKWLELRNLLNAIRQIDIILQITQTKHC